MDYFYITGDSNKEGSIRFNTETLITEKLEKGIWQECNAVLPGKVVYNNPETGVHVEVGVK